MGLFERFKSGLTRTREATIGKVTGLLKRNRIDADTLEELEDALLEADLGVAIVDDILEKLQESQNNSNGNTPSELLKRELISILSKDIDLPIQRFSDAPWVVFLVGVNGSGKTTTAGKLAHYFGQQGKKTLIAAADTFRAAAIEQLETWAERSNSRIIKSKHGADPASLTYDAYQSAKAKGEDVLIVDTAGRLQSHRNLMEELGKIRRVVTRLNPSAPHEVLLVIDSTTGQNGLSQARSFTAAAGVTGLVVTKLDGTARGGIVVPIRQELNLPIEFIGLGESIDDLHLFDSELYVNALLDS